MNSGTILRQITAWTLVVCLMPLLSGCETAKEYSFTHKLWAARSFYEPAPKANLQLFETGPPDQVLVQYDEWREKNEKIQRRAYFLQPALERTRANRRPQFVSPDKAGGRKPIPLSAGLTNLPFATVSTNGHEFTLHLPEHVSGPHHLPVYEDRSGQAMRVALTPLAVAGDVVMVGVVASVVAGVIALCGLCGAGCSFAD